MLSNCYRHSSIMAFSRQNLAAANLSYRLLGCASIFFFQSLVSLLSCFSLSKFYTVWQRWVKRWLNQGLSEQNTALVFMISTCDFSFAILPSSLQARLRKISPTNLNSSLTLLNLIPSSNFSAYSYFFSLNRFCACSRALTTFCYSASGQPILFAVSKNLVSCYSLSYPVKASIALPP